MNVNMDMLLEIAIRTAEKSDVKHRVACLLVDRRGNVVATGYNHHSQKSGRLGQWTIHAECDALQKVRKPSGNLTAFIYRHNNNPIHPCPCCSSLLRAYGIQRVISMHSYEVSEVE